MKKILVGFLLMSFFWTQFQSVTLASPRISQNTTQIATPIAVLDRLFTASSPEAELFDPSFLEQIPLANIDKIFGQIQQTLGNYQNVQETENGYLIVFEQGSVPAQISLNENGQIIYLFFQPPIGNSLSWTEILQQLEEFSGEIGFLVTKDGEAIAQLNRDRPLAVGSAFKLAVLAALQKEIIGENLAWDDVVKLDSQWQSLPSGILQDWQAGFPVTLHTLATLMISLSDNTATDALIFLLGREKVEAFSDRNQPFLTTREAFILKNPENQTFLQQYRDGDEKEKRQVLAAARSASLPNANLFTGNPIATDIEWFFTSRELCSLMAEVGDLPLMSVNPGIANPADWQTVAFKGGSEPGVLNFTTQLVDKTGSHYCLTLTWNDDKPLDEIRLLTIYTSAIAALSL
ncbi:serine hydrolase [Spirulina sp. 06S082]|uniref:serine hydrolase n=1 Tax=Spirulina sp. 06S082 TaxID=3110248 RepID=UPI002B1F48FB|nr:serine hydrolase [Spirulina sp. 06S082]MEA5469315.1 serine hydrolase [Spirulina sp. 06S082]